MTAHTVTTIARPLPAYVKPAAPVTVARPIAAWYSAIGTDRAIVLQPGTIASVAHDSNRGINGPVRPLYSMHAAHQHDRAIVVDYLPEETPHRAARVSVPLAALMPAARHDRGSIVASLQHCSSTDLQWHAARYDSAERLQSLISAAWMDPATLTIAALRDEADRIARAAIGDGADYGFIPGLGGFPAIVWARALLPLTNNTRAQSAMLAPERDPARV